MLEFRRELLRNAQSRIEIYVGVIAADQYLNRCHEPYEPGMRTVRVLYVTSRGIVDHAASSNRKISRAPAQRLRESSLRAQPERFSAGNWNLLRIALG